MVEQVYKTAWAAEIAKSSGGKSPPRPRRRLRKAQGDGAGPAEPPRDSAARERRERREGHGGPEEAAREARELPRLDVPPANIELFQKYEAEIKKYAMGGLEWIGL